MIALLTSEALQMVNVGPRAHHHLESWNNFAACCTVTGVSEESVKKKETYSIITILHINIYHIIFFYARSSKISDMIIVIKCRRKNIILSELRESDFRDDAGKVVRSMTGADGKFRPMRDGKQ